MFGYSRLHSGVVGGGRGDDNGWRLRRRGALVSSRGQRYRIPLAPHTHRLFYNLIVHTLLYSKITVHLIYTSSRN